MLLPVVALLVLVGSPHARDDDDDERERRIRTLFRIDLDAAAADAALSSRVDATAGCMGSWLKALRLTLAKARDDVDDATALGLDLDGALGAAQGVSTCDEPPPSVELMIESDLIYDAGYYGGDLFGRSARPRFPLPYTLMPDDQPPYLLLRGPALNEALPVAIPP